MRITESRLRRIIRQVIREENIVRVMRGNIDLDKRGKEIDWRKADRLKSYYEKNYKENGYTAGNTKVADRLLALLGGVQGNTNENVISPENPKQVSWAMENDPNALIPEFMIENDKLNSDSNVIVFRTIGTSEYYMLKLDGTPFHDAPDDHIDLIS
jgi:hypothetical protein